MEKEKLVEEIRKLKHSLEEMEKRLSGSEVPLTILEDFKMAVDHIRLTVWAILSTAQTDQYEAAASIVRFRLKRIMEMCRQVVMDIDANELTVDSPELKQLHASMKDTIARIDRLYQSGV